MKRGLTDIQLQVLGSIAENGKQNIQEIQLSEDLNYATTNRSVKMLDKLSLAWLSDHDESKGPKAPQYYGLTPLGAVEVFLRGSSEQRLSGLLEHWGEVSPRYIHNWGFFGDGLREYFWKCLLRLYPERVVYNRVLPLGLHVILRDFIKREKFSTIRDSLDQELFEVAAWGWSRSEKASFTEVVSGDSEYLRVWVDWFSVQENKFNRVRMLNRDILGLSRH